MNGLLLSSVVAALSLAFVAGCGDADRYRTRYRAGGGPAEDSTLATDPSDSDGVGASDSPSSGDVDGDNGGSAGNAAIVGGDAGSPGPTPSTDGGAPANVFTGQPAFAAGNGASTNGHPGGDPAGQACFGCHGNGEFSMVMGGTVYADALGTTPAAQTQVMFKVGAEVFTAFTNAQGNFLVRGPRRNGAGMAGARSATSTNPMIGAAASGDCNSCHDGTTTTRIHVP